VADCLARGELGMPIPCEKCGRKSYNKRQGFISLSWYECSKCGNEIMQVETDLAKLVYEKVQRQWSLNSRA
jgi:ribosomal protein L37AE/L43A